MTAAYKNTKAPGTAMFSAKMRSPTSQRISSSSTFHILRLPTAQFKFRCASLSRVGGKARAAPSSPGLRLRRAPTQFQKAAAS